MVQRSILSIRVEEKVKEALEKAAADDGRSMSQLAERILMAWLKENKWLK